MNSHSDKKGVSSHRLNEILWFDKSDKDARKDRAVNMARLKLILKGVGNIEVLNQTGYCKLEAITVDVYIDYFTYFDLIENKKLDEKHIIELIDITKNGTLLLNLDF